MKRNYLNLFLISLLVSGLFSGCSSFSTKIYKPFKLGQIAFRAENYREAESYYTQAIDANTDNLNIGKIYIARADARMKLQKIDKAIDDVKNSMAYMICETSPESCKMLKLVTIGIFMNKHNKYKEAEKYFNQALAVALYASADFWKKKGNLKRAMSNYDLAKEIYPDVELINLELAKFKNNGQNNYNADEKHINRDIGHAFVFRGRFVYEREDSKLAMSNYNMAIKYDPDDAFVYYARAKYKVFLGDLSGALDDIEKAEKTTNMSEYSKLIKEVKLKISTKSNESEE